MDRPMSRPKIEPCRSGRAYRNGNRAGRDVGLALRHPVSMPEAADAMKGGRHDDRDGEQRAKRGKQPSDEIIHVPAPRVCRQEPCRQYAKAAAGVPARPVGGLRRVPAGHSPDGRHLLSSERRRPLARRQRRRRCRATLARADHPPQQLREGATCPVAALRCCTCRPSEQPQPVNRRRGRGIGAERVIDLNPGSLWHQPDRRHRIHPSRGTRHGSPHRRER